MAVHVGEKAMHPQSVGIPSQGQQRDAQIVEPFVDPLGRIDDSPPTSIL
jgi:hypothetical protein